MKKVEADRYASGEAPLPSRVTMGALNGDVASDVAATRFADYCPDLAETLVRREVAAVEIAAPLKLDPTASLADQRVIADVGAHDAALSQQRARVVTATATHDAAKAELVKTPLPWSRWRTVGIAAFFILLAAALGAVTSLVLAPTIDSFYLHRYYETRTDDPDTVALYASHAAAAGIFFLLCVAQLAGVLWKSSLGVERDGTVVTPHFFGLLILDLAFAGAWGVQRLSAGGAWPMVVGITLLELVAAGAFSYALTGFGAALARNAPVARAYKRAKDTSRVAERNLTAVRRDQEHAEHKRGALLDAVSDREAADRTAPQRQALVEQTTRARHLIAVAAMAAEQAMNPSDTRMTDDIDELHAARRARLIRTVNPSAKKKGR